MTIASHRHLLNGLVPTEVALGSGPKFTGKTMFHNPGFFRFCLFLLILYLSLVPFSLSVADISFNRDGLPILSDNCFKCQGPDQRTRQANLRLDLKGSTLWTENPVIQPRDVGNNQLIVRIVAEDPMRVMPPPSSKLELTSEQIKTLKQWVAVGIV